MTTIKRKVTLKYDPGNARSTFVDAKGQLFLCVDGLKKYWTIPKTAKRLEVTLTSQEPTDNRQAHRIAFPGFGSNAPWCIDLCPLPGEDWFQQKNDTYLAFDRFTTKFVRQAGQRDGWMQVHILED